MNVRDLTIKRYEQTDAALWNSFVSSARNATFLFDRAYMDYHADRFSDHSLLVFSDGKLCAVLPAHLEGETLHSHNGLTYGGLVYSPKTHLPDVIAIFRSLLKFLAENGIRKLHLKLIPPMYCDMPSDDLAYALFLSDAKLTRRDSLSVLELQAGGRISTHRNQAANRGVKHKLEIREEAIFDAFWNDILIPNLHNRYGAKPVHSLEEIQLLHARFTKSIRHFNVYQDGRPVAGTTVFETRHVAHPQYVSALEDRSELGSLDFLYRHLITEVFAGKRYFDFGPSNLEQGRKLNGGISFWKQSFGAGTMVQDFYEVDTAHYQRLDHVLL